MSKSELLPPEFGRKQKALNATMEFTNRHLSKVHGETISPVQQGIRWVQKEAYLYLYNNTILHPERIKEAEDALEDGALFIVGNHPGQRETTAAYIPAFMSKVLRGRNILTGVAEHQKQPIIPGMNALAHAKIDYIPTKDTKEKYEQKGFKIVNEIKKFGGYIKDLADTFDNHGISITFPQGGRRPTLYNPKNTETISSMYRSLATEFRRRGKPMPKISVTFVGYDFPGINFDDPAITEHMNKKADFTINVGHTLNINTLLDRVGGDPKLLDQAVLAELEKYVSPDYLGSGPLQEDSDYPERPTHPRFTVLESVPDPEENKAA